MNSVDYPGFCVFSIRSIIVLIARLVSSTASLHSCHSSETPSMEITNFGMGGSWKIILSTSLIYPSFKQAQFFIHKYHVCLRRNLSYPFFPSVCFVLSFPHCWFFTIISFQYSFVLHHFHYFYSIIHNIPVEPFSSHLKWASSLVTALHPSLFVECNQFTSFFVWNVPCAFTSSIYLLTWSCNLSHAPFSITSPHLISNAAEMSIARIPFFIIKFWISRSFPILSQIFISRLLLQTDISSYWYFLLLLDSLLYHVSLLFIFFSNTTPHALIPSLYLQ